MTPEQQLLQEIRETISAMDERDRLRVQSINASQFARKPATLDMLAQQYGPGDDEDDDEGESDDDEG